MDPLADLEINKESSANSFFNEADPTACSSLTEMRSRTTGPKVLSLKQIEIKFAESE
jgi:hypothetical protein